MELSLDELELIKNKAFKAGYDYGYKTGFDEGYVEGVDFSDSCLADRIDELEVELKELKDKMRDATPEEVKGVDDYINSISKPTGISFYDKTDIGGN